MSTKTPTPKQVRHHYAKIVSLRSRLQDALNDAHNAGVIVYDQTKYSEESPCKTLYQTSDRIEKTTHDALAAAMRAEIRSHLKR